MSKPKLILITGRAGSGKTILAKLLAPRTGFKYIDSDAEFEKAEKANKVKSGHKPQQYGPAQFLESLSQYAKSDINVITELVLHRGVHEDLIIKLSELWSPLIIHCYADNARERFYKRALGTDNEEPDWLKEAMAAPINNKLEEAMRKPLKVDIPIIQVNTIDGYNPSIDDIITEVMS